MLKRDHILIIDDHVELVDTLKKILDKENYYVESARTAKESLQKLKENFYSLLILDIKLPDRDGIILLESIKDTKPKTRKIIITGYPSIENAQEAINKNVDAYMIKPFSPEKLLEKVIAMEPDPRWVPEAKRDKEDAKRLLLEVQEELE